MKPTGPDTPDINDTVNDVVMTIMSTPWAAFESLIPEELGDLHEIQCRMHGKLLAITSSGIPMIVPVSKLESATFGVAPATLGT